jgi:hypothetical protein
MVTQPQFSPHSFLLTSINNFKVALGTTKTIRSYDPGAVIKDEENFHSYTAMGSCTLNPSGDVVLEGNTLYYHDNFG